VAKALQALGLAQQTSKLGSKLGGGEAAGGLAGLSPGATEAGLTGAGIPGTEAEAQAAVQAALAGGAGGAEGTVGGTGGLAGAAGGEAAGEAASMGGGLTSAAALIPLVLSALQLAGVKMPKPITAAQQFGSIGEETAGINLAMNPSWANAARAGEALATFGLSEVGRSLFGGPAPSSAFPHSSWQKIASQVKGALPPPIPMPPTATPEQQTLIQDVNDQIKGLQEGYGDPSGAAQAKSGFGGTQSAETWNNSLHHLKTILTKQFAELGPLYQKALEASQGAPPINPAAQAQAQTLPAGFFEGEQKKLPGQ